MKRFLMTLSVLLVGGVDGESARGATLQQLLGGASIDVWNSRFRDWQLVSLDATAGASPDLSLINVNALVDDALNPGLQFASTNQLSTAGINSLDMLLRFRVEAVAGANSFAGYSLSMTGINFGGSGGISYISGEVRSHLGVDLGPAVVIADNESGVNQFVATSNFPPQPGMLVTTNVFLTGLAATDSINLTSFTQRFSQTSGSLLVGDFNHNGVVDAADYVVWRRSNGPPDGFRVWREHYGETTGGNGASLRTIAGAAAVPEPVAALCVPCVLSICVRRGRRSRTGKPYGKLRKAY